MYHLHMFLYIPNKASNRININRLPPRPRHAQALSQTTCGGSQSTVLPSQEYVSPLLLQDSHVSQPDQPRAQPGQAGGRACSNDPLLSADDRALKECVRTACQYFRCARVYAMAAEYTICIYLAGGGGFVASSF